MVWNFKNWFVHFLDDKTDTIHDCAVNAAFKEASVQEATTGNLVKQGKSTSLQEIKGVNRN